MTLFLDLWLFVSCCIGALSLIFIEADPAGFDKFRTNDRMKRAHNVASVMIMGPFWLLVGLLAATIGGKNGPE